MPSGWWRGPTVTGFALTCEWDTVCQEEALALVWIRGKDGQVRGSALCLPHVVALAFPPAVAA